MRLLALTFCCGLLLSGCATRPKTYSAPDQTAVLESTRKVKEGIKKSRQSAAEAKRLVVEAQKSADKISLLSVGLMTKIEDLLKIAPAELKPPLEAIKFDASEMQAEEQTLSTGLASAWNKQDQLERHLVETDAYEADLEKRQADYHRQAQQLADAATNENKHRIIAEKKLSWYRYHWWGSWIALGLGILACVAFTFLKVTGRMALKAAI